MQDEERLEELGRRIVKSLYSEGMIRTWYKDRPEGWKLASGLYSPFFISLRPISSVRSGSIELYRMAGEALSIMLRNAGFIADGRHRIVGIAMAGIALANAATLNSGIPSLYTRKLPEEVKTPKDVEAYLGAHGQKSLVEGDFNPGDTIGVVDDLVSTFGSKELAISQIRQEVERRGAADVKINDIFVLLDREQGGGERARELGYNLHALIPFASRGLGWLREDLEPVEYDTIVSYLKDPGAYQSGEAQEKLKSLALKGNDGA
ncbi:MAG: hypothetical protein M1321_01910 [Candidatus Marsarchaeota archaeon]|jgi:uridine monophosphate synthetase|nr:hypothetical protein [Candidatus Marsarchaeota archaeon]